SLDHLIGTREQRRRDFEAEGFRGLQVDHELESRGLIDRQVGGVLALENPRDLESSAAVAVWNVVGIAHQPPRRDIYAVGVHRGMASRAASATICCRRLARNESAETNSTSARCCRKVAKALSISLGTLALRPPPRRLTCARIPEVSDSSSWQ